MPTAAETHDAMVGAYNEQRSRVLGEEPRADAWTGRTAARFRDDPRRPLDTILEAIAGYLRADDVLLDIGGGAGRLGLPLAFRCREVIDVDPSGGMREQFESLVTEAGIRNARYLQQDWMQAQGISGDVALVAHVTYFVPDIAAFITKVRQAARRRVILHVLTVPPPNTTAQMFRIIYGEPQALVPADGELVAVLQEMGLTPEVRLVEAPRERAGALAVLPTREAAVEAALIGPWMRRGDEDRVRRLVAQHFDELFTPVEGGYMRKLSEAARPVLITWETAR
jgi:hypothetical protein